MKQSNLRLAALFLLSVTTIAFELAVMRTFSVGSWSNFGSMVISIALLGYGLAGTLITFIQKYIRKAPNKWLSYSAMALMPAMAVSHVLAQQVPFNPVMIVADSGQLLLIGAYYLLYSIPFFIGALFIGVIFLVLSSKIHQLYFWNMAGSGIGGIIILICMYIFPPDYLIVPLLILGFLTAVLCFMKSDSETGKMRLESKYLITAFITFSCSVIVLLAFGKINVSDFKPVSYVRDYEDVKEDFHSFSPTGEMHVYSSANFHFAPGLSDLAAVNLETMPEEAFKGLYIDGGGPIGIQRKMAPGEDRYMEYLPISAPYELMENPDVLLVRLGGGMSIFTANYHNAQKIQVLEPDPAIIKLIGEAEPITRYNGNLLKKSNVNVKQGEPRAFCATTKERFELVEISLIDGVGLSSAGGYSVNENYTYTVEAIEDYMRCLEDNGILSITVWNKLTPARNVPKLLSTVVASLRKQGIQNPGEHVVMFNVLLSTATVLVRKTPFEAAEIGKLRKFCRRMAFDMTYYPGMPVRETNFEEMLQVYQKQFKDVISQQDKHSMDNLEVKSTSAEEKAPVKMIQDDFYHHTLQWLINGKEKELYKKYVFDITPATDNRPYYTAYLKPHTIGMFLDQLGEVSAEWGYLLLLGTFLQSLFFGLLIILVPMLGRWKDLYKGKKGIGGVILYYACLGLAYMLVEIYLIQKLVFFLGDPIFSVSIVITSMLIISGLGSLFCERFKENRSKGVQIAVIGIGVSILFYMFGLTPCQNLFLGVPFIGKALLAILFIAPAAFFMGMPFPSGLSTLTKHRQNLLPWAWGMNGALSVTGSVVAKLISISYGFIWVLGLAIFLYIIAAIVFRANEGEGILAPKKA